MIKKFVLLGVALCVGSSAYAGGKKNIAKNLVKAATSKMVSAAGKHTARQSARISVNRQVARATVKQHQSRKQVPGKTIHTADGTLVYHEVFGYIPKPGTVFQDPTMYFAVGDNFPSDDYDDLIQRGPLFEHQAFNTFIGPGEAFDFAGFTDFVTITQAAYLWRVAHPEKSLQDNPYLYQWAQRLLKQEQDEVKPGEKWIWEAPNSLLLKQLVRPGFTPASYAKLYELTPVYPKHITLNNYGFPVKTADDDYANVLDAYLMLSNPKEMEAYNTCGKYTPFILTKEEHAAADKLLALRLQGEKLPADPTVADVLELAYNRLETHTIPYSQIDAEDVDSGIYKAYPNYKNTQLYRTVKGMIKDQQPIENNYRGYTSLENVDMTHLIVLDAVMGGVDPENLADVRRALYAFDSLCADVHPDAKQLIEHLAVLQRNLRIVFADLLRLNDLKIDWATGQDPRWQKAELASYAYCVLDRPIRDLVGRNW